MTFPATGRRSADHDCIVSALDVHPGTDASRDPLGAARIGRRILLPWTATSAMFVSRRLLAGQANTLPAAGVSPPIVMFEVLPAPAPPESTIP